MSFSRFWKRISSIGADLPIFRWALLRFSVNRAQVRLESCLRPASDIPDFQGARHWCRVLALRYTKLSAISCPEVLPVVRDWQTQYEAILARQRAWKVGRQSVLERQEVALLAAQYHILARLLEHPAGDSRSLPPGTGSNRLESLFTLLAQKHAEKNIP